MKKSILGVGASALLLTLQANAINLFPEKLGDRVSVGVSGTAGLQCSEDPGTCIDANLPALEISLDVKAHKGLRAVIVGDLAEMCANNAKRNFVVDNHEVFDSDDCDFEKFVDEAKLIADLGAYGLPNITIVGGKQHLPLSFQKYAGTIAGDPEYNRRTSRQNVAIRIVASPEQLQYIGNEKFAVSVDTLEFAAGEGFEEAFDLKGDGFGDLMAVRVSGTLHTILGEVGVAGYYAKIKQRYGDDEEHKQIALAYQTPDGNWVLRGAFTDIENGYNGNEELLELAADLHPEWFGFGGVTSLNYIRSENDVTSRSYNQISLSNSRDLTDSVKLTVEGGKKMPEVGDSSFFVGAQVDFTLDPPTSADDIVLARACDRRAKLGQRMRMNDRMCGKFWRAAALEKKK